MNYKGSIKEGKVISSRIKKKTPISLITCSNAIFIKKKLNNIATSYINDSQAIQNTKFTNSNLVTSNINNSKNKTKYNLTNPNSLINKLSEKKKKEFSISINRKNFLSFSKKKQEIHITSYSHRNSNKTSLNKNKKNNTHNRLKTSSNYNLNLDYKTIKNKLILSRQKKEIKKKNISSENSFNLNNNSFFQITTLLKNHKNLSNNVTRNIIKNSVQHSLKNSFVIQNEKSIPKKISKDQILKRQNYIEKKNMFKMFFNKKRNSKTIQLKVNLNEKYSNYDKTQNKKESEIFKTMNNVNTEENILNNQKLNSNINKKIENKRTLKRNQVNLNIFGLSKNYKNKISENLKDSLNISLDNIDKVLSQKENLNNNKEIEVNEIEELRSIIKKLDFMNIKKYDKNIFLIKQNKEYESFINTFNKIYDKNINQKNSYLKKTPSTIEESIKDYSSNRNSLCKNFSQRK